MTDLERWVGYLAKCQDRDDVDFLLECANEEGKLTALEQIDLWLVAAEYANELDKLKEASE